MFELFEEFKKLAKHERIQNPYGRIETAIESVYLTRISLKHLAEKGSEGERLLRLITLIVSEPDEIRRGSIKNRFLLVKSILHRNRQRSHAVILETMPDDRFTIVTAFQSDERYLSNFELLWRAEGS